MKSIVCLLIRIRSFRRKPNTTMKQRRSDWPTKPNRNANMTRLNRNERPTKRRDNDWLMRFVRYLIVFPFCYLRLHEQAEAKRKADEAESKRKHDEAEAKRKADEAEKKRKADEAESKRMADEVNEPYNVRLFRIEMNQ